MKNNIKRLLIMSAGTGGHIFPGLAIANTMRARGWKIFWLGTTHGMECDLVPKYDIELDTLAFTGIRGKGIIHMLKGIWQILVSFKHCFKIFNIRQPDLVLGMGGYLTVPGGIVASLCGLSLILINADITLLLSNKLLLPLSKKILFGFPNSFSITNHKAEITGNALRKEIFALSLPVQRYANRRGVLHILIIGGSLGAKIFNECIPVALSKLPLCKRPIITHQSGKKHIQTLRTTYLQANIQAEVIDFIDDMSSHYAKTDIVICRAGAITISELTAVGIASILVPLITKTTTHQYDNACWMAKYNAALHFPQIKMTPDNLAKLLQKIDRATCMQLAQAAYKQGKRNANETIAQALEKLVKKL